MALCFSRSVKAECRKATHNRLFLIALTVGLLCGLFSAWYMIDSYYYYLEQNAWAGGDPMVKASTLFNSWIGGETQSLGFSVWTVLFPLLAMVPYGWSYAVEHKSGYDKHLITKTNKATYFLSKYIATFLSGGIVVLVPLVVNLLLVACFVPAFVPNSTYDIYYGVFFGNIWSELFYTVPVVHTFLFLLLNFVYAGLFACLCLSLSLIIRNRIAVLLLPYLFLMALHYCSINLYVGFFEISPLFFLHATTIFRISNAWIILAMGIALFALTFGITVKAGTSREIY